MTGGTRALQAGGRMPSLEADARLEVRMKRTLLPAAFLAALLLAGCPPKTEPPPAQPVQLSEADFCAVAPHAIEDGLESLR